MSKVSEWESESCESSESSERSERVWEWLLSIDMKTKVVQHVERESEWQNETVNELENERVWECERALECDFSALTWKQKLFSMSRESEWECENFESFESFESFPGSQTFRRSDIFYNIVFPLIVHPIAY